MWRLHLLPLCLDVSCALFIQGTYIPFGYNVLNRERFHKGHCDKVNWTFIQWGCITDSGDSGTNQMKIVQCINFYLILKMNFEIPRLKNLNYCWVHGKKINISVWNLKYTKLEKFEKPRMSDANWPVD